MYRSIKMTSLVLGFLFFVFVVYSTFHIKFNSVLAEPRTTYIHSQSFDLMQKNLECMAINIYREAGYEPIEGRIAVAQVTMNRVAHPDFPDDVCQVVYQRSVIISRVVCQFSWYCDSSHRNRPINQKAYDESYEVAKKVMLEGFRLEMLKDALYYHADYVSPNWKLEKIGKIGTHIFYKQKGGDHERLAGI